MYFQTFILPILLRLEEEAAQAAEAKEIAAHERHMETQLTY